MSDTNHAKLRWVRRRDKIARWVVTLGGLAVIVSVIGILFLIAGTTLPLFWPARARVHATLPLPAPLKIVDVLALGVDIALGDQRMLGYVIARDGKMIVLDLESGQVLQEEDCRAGVMHAEAGDRAGRAAHTLRAAERVGAGAYSLLWSDGVVSLLQVNAPAGRREDAKFVVRTRGSVPPERDRAPLLATMRVSEKGTVTCAALVAEQHVVVTRQVASTNALDEVTYTNQRVKLGGDLSAPINTLALDGEGNTLYAGTADGCLVWWRFGSDGEVVEHDVVSAFRDRRAITSMAVAVGDMTLAVGDDQGELTNWCAVRTAADSTRKLRLTRSLQPHDGPVRHVACAGRNRALLSLNDQGTASLDFMTSRRHLLSFSAAEPLRHVALSGRALSAQGDAVLGLDAVGNLTAWRIDCPHPEVSWRTLFGKASYEGYDDPAFVWQATGGEEYESKYSIMPLLLGTLKGTFYAMLFGVPLALAGAAYVSHFTSPAFKAWIKPGIEIMAAVPSVVLGFLIALWLAPRLERGLMTLLASLIALPLVFLGFLLAWQAVRHYDWAKRVAQGREFLLAVPVIVLGIVLAAWLSGPLEDWLFAGNLRHWLAEELGMRYDQRNCIIIAFGLGFAVIPIIFSLADDALSSVPHTMTAASMALGASRWQTLWRVVLPSASPGIFAAVMIGLGRAVGETMIVLMATGNTPIMDWSPFNGMRTLSANIAVEIPEAAVGSTHYRVLFLCAVLLFALTFILNTTAEVVRQRLRKRFGRY